MSPITIEQEKAQQFRMGRPPLVAIVDDEISIVRALVRLLRPAGFEVQAYSSARVFIEELDTLSFDCLVLDLQMPAMTGLELQRYLRTASPNLVLPVIMITAHDEAGMRERCLAAGVSIYLRKPIECSVLLSEIARLMDSRTA